MKKHFGLALVIFLVVLSALNFSCQKMSCALKSDLPWCQSTLKDADAQFAAGNYEQAISLYQAYLGSNPDASKLIEVKNKISDSYYNLGEKAFNTRSWSDAISFYQQSQNPMAPSKISKCYFNLGDDFYAQGDYQAAIDSYQKSNEPGVQAKIQAAQDALLTGDTATLPPDTQTIYINRPGKPNQRTKQSESFVIKVATPSSLAEANNMVNAVRRQGITAYSSKQKGKSNVVFAGPFGTRDKAQVALAKIHAMGKGYKRAFIVKKD